MLCARTRSVGLHGCRTRVSAGGGRGAAGTGGHHGYNSSNIEIYYRHALYLLWKRLSPYALVLLLLFLPRYAFAAPSLEVDGNFAGYEDGEEYKGYVVVDSPDNYQSTLCLIGEFGKLIQITTEQYETLSNPSTGGAFYELSQQWRKIGHNASFTEEYYPQWMALSKDYADGLVTVYGYGRVWAAVCTDELKQQAKRDFNTIIGGGTVGGGSSNNEGVVSGNYIYFNWTEIYDATQISDTVGVAFSKTQYESVYNKIKAKDDNLNICIAYGANGNSYEYSSCDVKYSVTTGNNTRFVFDEGTKFLWRNRWTNMNFVTYEGNKYLLVSDAAMGQLVGSAVQTQSANFNTNVIPAGAQFYDGAPVDGGGGTDEPSPDPWEPPTSSPDPPTNPTTPTPKDPITPDPPSLPGPPSDPVTPTPPSSPALPTDTTHTVDLQGILDALSEHCIHIQTCLNSNFSGQNSYLGELFSTYTAAIVDQIFNGDQTKIEAINEVNNTIAQGFNDILEYWDEYVNWLDDKLDFKWPEVDEYDDTDLLSWLKKIWARQGTGDVNTRPVDPATNYGGMSKWLGVLYGEIAGDVSDTSLTALSSSLNALQHTFPFSLPWDIQQILQALDATPATPAASITVPALAGAWDAYSYDIDLHWMDSPMVAVRGFELLAFVLYCLVHTKEVFGYVVGD